LNIEKSEWLMKYLNAEASHGLACALMPQLSIFCLQNPPGRFFLCLQCHEISATVGLGRLKSRLIRNEKVTIKYWTLDILI